MSPNPGGGRVRRVVTTRAGGVSLPPYDRFNLGDHVGDDPVAVAANRSRLAAAIGLPAERLVWMEQVHSSHVTVVAGPRVGPVPRTDALVTTEADLALVVLTADCVPILLSDDRAGVIAAVHAGRMGARSGILEGALAELWRLGALPETTRALLGPAASGRHYEVPAAMADEVEARLPGSRCRTVAGTHGLDLRAGLAGVLGRAGVTAVDVDPRCTIEDHTLFSHRREGTTGRIAGVIWRDAAR